LHGFYLWVEKAYRDARKKLPGKPALATSEYIKSSFVPEITRPVEGRFPNEKKHQKNLTNFFLALCTFFLINVTWVFFRSPDFTSAWRLLHSMFIRNSTGAAILSWVDISKISLIIVALVISHWLMRNTMVLKVTAKMPWWLLGIVWASMLVLISLSQNATSSFIYFQF
jgi:alginate O-acetyltransferase complex protein AlgI